MIHVLGAIGPILLLGAYLMLSMGRLSGSSATYQLMNLGGSAVLIAYSYVLEAWVSVVLNVIWALVAGVTLLRRRAA